MRISRISHHTRPIGRKRDFPLQKSGAAASRYFRPEGAPPIYVRATFAILRCDRPSPLGIDQHNQDQHRKRTRGFSRCSGLLLFQHVAGQKAHQPAFEARHSLGLPDGGFRLLRAP